METLRIERLENAYLLIAGGKDGTKVYAYETAERLLKAVAPLVAALVVAEPAPAELEEVEEPASLALPEFDTPLPPERVPVRGKKKETPDSEDL